MHTDDLVRRAFAAYFRSGGTDQLDVTRSGEVTHNGLRYVVLRNGDDVLAVYRVIARITWGGSAPAGSTNPPGEYASSFGLSLKRMKRWPAAIEKDFA